MEDYKLNPESFCSQKAMVRSHLLDGKPITQLEALKLYGSLRLSAIIYDLRDEGIPIEMERICVSPRKRVGSYYIKSEHLKNLAK